MSPDPTLDRLFRQEPWALAKVFARLRELPEETLSFTAPSTDWDVATFLAHIVSANRSYVARMEGRPDPAPPPAPDTHADLVELERIAIEAAVRLRELAAEGLDVEVVEQDGGKTFRYPRSLILAQAIYHSIEHRAQMFGVLTANGVGGLNLDDMDHWNFGEHEGDLSES